VSSRLILECSRSRGIVLVFSSAVRFVHPFLGSRLISRPALSLGSG
jgi:hypothetical protein